MFNGFSYEEEMIFKNKDHLAATVIFSNREPLFADKFHMWTCWIYEMEEPTTYAYPYIKVYVQISKDREKPNWRNYEFPGHISGHECPRYWRNSRTGKIVSVGDMVPISEYDEWQEIK